VDGLGTVPPFWAGHGKIYPITIGLASCIPVIAFMTIEGFLAKRGNAAINLDV
jgi:hypothetical protein